MFSLIANVSPLPAPKDLLKRSPRSGLGQRWQPLRHQVAATNPRVRTDVWRQRGGGEQAGGRPLV